MSGKIFEEEFIGTEAVSLVVTCHKDYLKYLPDQVAHVDNQKVRPAQRIIVYDGADYHDTVEALRRKHPSWIVVGWEWKSPGLARNRALRLVHSEWVMFVDADDMLPAKHVYKIVKSIAKVAGNIGVIYGDLVYSDGRIMRAPETFRYWNLRKANYISAASAWRVAALHDVGGFSDVGLYEDWGLVLRLTAAGWKGMHSGARINCRWHKDRRSDAGVAAEFGFKWRERTYAMVTLLSGSEEKMRNWLKWLEHAELPPRLFIWVVDNSCNPKFARSMMRGINKLDIPYRRIECTKECIDPDSRIERHKHVAYLYNQALTHPAFRADYVVTLEDDVTPPLDGLKMLVHAQDTKSNPGVMSAAYPMRGNPELAVGRMLP